MWSMILWPSEPMKVGTLPTLTISIPAWRAKLSSFFPLSFSLAEPAARVWTLLSLFTIHGMLLVVHQLRRLVRFWGISGFGNLPIPGRKDHTRYILVHGRFLFTDGSKEKCSQVVPYQFGILGTRACQKWSETNTNPGPFLSY